MADESVKVPGAIKSGAFEYEGNNLTVYVKYGREAGQASDPERVCFNITCAGETKPEHMDMVIKLVSAKLGEFVDGKGGSDG